MKKASWGCQKSRPQKVKQQREEKSKLQRCENGPSLKIHFVNGKYRKLIQLAELQSIPFNPKLEKELL
jgi:hypothetical protein